ncbi:hypothetical protein Tco_0519885 [Tanacetum coccineum]
MSKRNLVIVTCSLSQSDLLEFVEKYGISMCDEPQLPSSDKTALDALEGYIPLYLSLFTIGNLRLPLNDFCMDVFEFFKCHFPLLNPFRVARVTTIAVACKAYGGEAIVPFFRYFLTLGPAGDWLMFQKRFGPSIPSIFSNSMSNIPDWKSEFIFMKQTFISEVCPGLITDFRHGQAQTFSDPILYLAGLASSWENTPNNPSILIDGEEMTFHNFMKKPGQTPSFFVRMADQPIDVGSPSVDRLKAAVENDQAESSSVSKDKDVSGLELAVVGEGFSGKNVSVAKGSKKRCPIMEALNEEAMVVRHVVDDNSSRPMPKKRKPEGPRRTCMRGSIPPFPTTAPMGVGKHPRVLARYIGNLASSLDSLTPDVEEAYSAQTCSPISFILSLKTSWTS